MLLTSKEKKTIKNEIKKNFKTLSAAKKIAKERFLKAENEAKEWQKLSKRKQMRVMPPSIYDTLVDVNGVDYLYYSSGKGRLMAREGKGYYVRMKTKSGVVDAKI